MMETHMVLLLLLFIWSVLMDRLCRMLISLGSVYCPFNQKKQKVVINYVNLPPSLAQTLTNSHRILIDLAENENRLLFKQKLPKLGTQYIAVEMWTRSNLNIKWQLIVCSCDLNFVLLSFFLFSRSGIAVGLRLVCRWSRYCKTGEINHAERLLWSINCEQFFIQRRICWLFSRKWNSCWFFFLVATDHHFSHSLSFWWFVFASFFNLSNFFSVVFVPFFRLLYVSFNWSVPQRWFRAIDSFRFFSSVFRFKWHPNLNWHANWLFIQRKKNYILCQKNSFDAG